MCVWAYGWEILKEKEESLTSLFSFLERIYSESSEGSAL